MVFFTMDNQERDSMAGIGFSIDRLLLFVDRYQNDVLNRPIGRGRKLSVLLVTFTAYGLLRASFHLYRLAGRIESWRD